MFRAWKYFAPPGGDATIGLCSVRGSHGSGRGASPSIGTHIPPNGGIWKASSTASSETGAASPTGWRRGQDGPESNNPITLRPESTSPGPAPAARVERFKRGVKGTNGDGPMAEKTNAPSMMVRWCARQ